MLHIRRARTEEYGAVWDFYARLIDEMAEAEYRPGWQKGVYPTAEFLRRSIGNGELYLGLCQGELAAVMVVNHQCTQGYETIPWRVQALPEEVAVVHALGVLPSYHGRGIAKEMVQGALQIARESGQKVVRLDVLGTNLPAQNLYLGMGFVYMGTLELFYEDTGLTDYLLYEYPLPPRSD